MTFFCRSIYKKSNRKSLFGIDSKQLKACNDCRVLKFVQKANFTKNIDSRRNDSALLIRKKPNYNCIR